MRRGQQIGAAFLRVLMGRRRRTGTIVYNRRMFQQDRNDGSNDLPPRIEDMVNSNFHISTRFKQSMDNFSFNVWSSYMQLDVMPSYDLFLAVIVQYDHFLKASHFQIQIKDYWTIYSSDIEQLEIMSSRTWFESRELLHSLSV